MSNLHNEQPANPSRAKAGQPLIVCTMLGIAPSWKWFAPIFDQIRWEFYGGNPRNWLDARLRGPPWVRGGRAGNRSSSPGAGMRLW